MRTFFFVLLIVLSPVYPGAQTVTYTTLFVPFLLTYNGSDNPNECWESVEYGILIQVDKGRLFFTLPSGDFERLKDQLANQEVLAEVEYFDERVSDSGAFGHVLKITCQGVVVFPVN